MLKKEMDRRAESSRPIDDRRHEFRSDVERTRALLAVKGDAIVHRPLHHGFGFRIDPGPDALGQPDKHGDRFGRAPTVSHLWREQQLSKRVILTPFEVIFFFF